MSSLNGKKIWQISAGDKNRNYVDYLLEWDVIAMGPGEYGPWPQCEQKIRQDKWTEKSISTLRRFCEDILPGDYVVLKLGTDQVYGFGEVNEEVLWFGDFGDIDGWGLEHVRRVKWIWKYSDRPKTFSTYELKWGDTVQSLDSAKVLSWAQNIIDQEEPSNKEIKSLPETCVDKKETPKLELNKVSDFLFDQGIAVNSINNLASQIDELVRISNWYNRNRVSISEYETIAYLVVPMLRALGWTPQKMAIEWSNMDLALFNSLPRNDSNLAVAVEVKKLNLSCLTAKSQAEDYAKQKGRENCKRLIVTDGIRYGVFFRDKEGSFSETPSAYLNLTRMMKSYPILKCSGAKEALLLMAPEWANNGFL